MLIGKADALVPSGHPEVMSQGMILQQELVREQAAEYEKRWHPGKAMLARICLNFSLWGLIIGGLDRLL